MFMVKGPISRGDIPGGRGSEGGRGRVGWAWRCKQKGIYMYIYIKKRLFMVWSGLVLFSLQKHGDFSEDHPG